MILLDSLYAKTNENLYHLYIVIAWYQPTNDLQEVDFPDSVAAIMNFGF